MANVHIKSAWGRIRRSPFQALAATFVLSATFFVATILSIVFYSSSQLVNYFETRPQIIAFLQDDATSTEITDLQGKVLKDERVKTVNYVSKEQALEIYKNATSDNPLLTQLINPSIFPASIEVSVTDISYAQDLINELKDEKVVDQVGFTASLGGEENLTDVISRLKTVTFYVRLSGLIFASLLAGTSFLVLMIIIGMRLTTRRGEMEILDLIGATTRFVRSPVILEAVFYAIFGVVVGWAFALVLTLYSTPSLIAYFGEIPILPRDTVGILTLFGAILGGELVAGLLLAMIGSFIAVSRVRKTH